MKFIRMAIWCGIAAPVLYFLTVLAGGALYPGFDHLRDPISALTATGAPWALALNVPFTIYNLLTLGFALGLFAAGRTLGGNFRWTAALLAIVALSGIAMLFFAMDPPGTEVTTPGLVHILLAAVESLGSMAAMALASAGWWQKRRGLPTIFSTGLLAIVFLSGGAASFAMANGVGIGGLYERITIGAFEFFMLATALYLSFGAGRIPGVETPLPDLPRHGASE